MAWTDAQQSAIDSRGENLLVSAAAGSGKTAVLVQRIIDIVLNEKVDVQNLLIVTFTNAAAAEMKDRIQKMLMQRMLDNPQESHYLTKQIQNLPRASISTMHSFCIDILRRNFHMLDLDPSFKIANNALVSIMKTQAMESLFDEAYDSDDALFLSLVDSYGGTKDDKKLSDLIDKVYNFIQSQPYPLKWLENEAESFNISSFDELSTSKWMQVIKDDIRIKLDAAYDAGKKAIELCKLDGGPIRYLEAIEDDLCIINDLKSKLEGSFADFIKAIAEVKHSKLATISKKMKEELDVALVDEVKAIRDTDIKASGIKAIQKSIKNISQGFQLEDIKNLYPLMKALYKTVARYDELYTEMKLANSVLDFSDLEHYALRLLENEAVREDLRAKYTYIFFDEYQDSNIVQETIISAIKREDNLFLVGDVKQSIYRFRLADPTLFIDKYHSYAKADDRPNKRIDLSNNFRSRPAILEFINDIFSAIMNEDLGEVAYDDSAKLIPGMDFPVEKNKVELVVLENHRLEEDDELAEDADMDNPELEAMYVSSRIKELLGKEHYNPKAKEFQKITYRDIVILMRSPKSSIAAFEKVLKDDRIPCYVDYSASYYDVLEVKLFIDLLKIIDNIEQDEALLAVMNSSIGGFSLDEIIEIRVAYKRGAIYQALLSYMADNDNELSIKIKAFLDRIKTYRFKEKLQRLDEFLWYLMNDTGYYSDLAAMPGGQMRQENLKALLDKASEFQSNTTNGLFNFLHYIDKLLKDKGDTQEAKALSESEDRVRIMSIHKSKGLEFPVVFVCGLSKGFNKADFKQDIMLHNSLGIGPKYVDLDKNVYRESLPKTAIKIQSNKEMLSEELRILYVALTRAVDTLIMVGSVKDIEKLATKASKSTSTSYLLSQSNYLSWMLIALYKHKDASALREYGVREVIEDDTSYKSSFKLSLVAKYDLLKLSQREREDIDNMEAILRDYKADSSENLNPEVISVINSRFSYEYPYKEQTMQVSKTSATMLAKSVLDASKISVAIQSMPRFMQKVKTFSASQRGTLMHFAMQNINLNQVSSPSEIEDQLDMMHVNELLTSEERASLDSEMLYEFFCSELGKRMRRSKNVIRENSFMLKKDEVLVSGVIDSYFEEDGEWVLIDYKTDYLGIGSKKDKAEMYRPQLELYKEALESSTDKAVKEAYIYLFDIQEAVRVI